MSDISTQSDLMTEAEQETILNQLFGEMQLLNEKISSDQADIERLKVETRII